MTGNIGGMGLKLDSIIFITWLWVFAFYGITQNAFADTENSTSASTAVTSTSSSTSSTSPTSSPTASGSPTPAPDKLENVALFKRCFAHLTGHIPSRSLSLYTSVKNKEIEPITACLQILDAVQIDATTGLAAYVVSGRSATADESTIASQVLQNFHSLHRTRFVSDNFETALPSGTRWSDTNIVHDETSPGLYLTRVLFFPGAPYSSVVTLTDTLEAVRSNGSQSVTTFTNNTYNSSTKASGTEALQTSTTNLGVHSGELIGLRSITANSTDSSATAKAAKKVRLDKSKTEERSLHQHLGAGIGGGILGSQAYLLLNHGQAEDAKSDGGLVIARRHARNSLKELLCRDIPPMRETDGIPYVQSETTSSTPAFRNSSTCMSCHASMDGFAGTTRQAYYSGINLSASGSPSMHMAFQNINSSSYSSRESGYVDSDSDFYKRPPYGRLLYRSYDGTLINQEVANIAEMGEAMANTNDLYVCAAKQYFYFFTGIQVSLQDVGDPAMSALSEADTHYRNQVIALGLALKENQNLKTLVHSIFESSLYQSRGQRDLIEETSASETGGGE